MVAARAARSFASFAVHQVVTTLGAGSLGTAFEKVILGGHRCGSVTSYLVADRYGGVDALIATGSSHRINIPAITFRLVFQSPPVERNPRFA